MNNTFFQVAKHTFQLSFSNTLFDASNLGNYKPFQVEACENNCLFHLSVINHLPTEKVYRLVGQFDDNIAFIGVFKSDDEDYRFQIACPNGKDHCTMDVETDFRMAKVKLPENKNFHFFFINNCLMLLYALSSVKFDTLLMHASVIKNKGEGFLFLGKSGTGKSTHSRLWLKHVDGSKLLNDDNPVIRIINGKIIVFGSPWSGKTPCYRNESAPLKGIVRLRQAPDNRIKELQLAQAYASILPACSCMKWEENIMKSTYCTVEKLATNVRNFLLECLPNEIAAQLCSTTIR